MQWTYERRCQGHERGFAHADQHAAQDEAPESPGQPAAGGGQCPDAQAHRYEAEGVVMLAGLCKDRRRHQQTNLQVPHPACNRPARVFAALRSYYDGK